jgi:RNA polymerase sigma-70 factor (ECF subfamily)
LSLSSVPESELPADPCDSPERGAEILRLYRVLDRMPAAERVVWVLRHVEGETLEDLVELCRCSKSTVQRRLRAAEAHFLSEGRE